MLSRDTLDQIPEIIADRLSSANEYMLHKLGDHINRLGQVLPSDMNRLEELHRAGMEVADIEKELAKRTERATAEIKALMDEGWSGFHFERMEEAERKLATGETQS